MEIDYSKLTEEQLSVLIEYHKDEMKKLKRVCHRVWGNKSVPHHYHDDLYDDAAKVLEESVVTYKSDFGKTDFNTYLKGNIKLSYEEWYRNTHLRAKRNNLLLDKKGKIVRDEKGRPTIIPNIFIDAPTEDGINISEKVSSDFKVEDEIEELNLTCLDEILADCSIEMQDYVNNILSKIQKKILELIINDYSKEKIIKILKIDSALYSDSIAAITSNKNTRNLRKALEDKRNVR